MSDSFMVAAHIRMPRDGFERWLATPGTDTSTIANPGAMFDGWYWNGRRADDEWRQAPQDEPLRGAHAAAVASARAAELARLRLAEADARHSEMEQASRSARDRLVTDAADMGLPESLEALRIVEAALESYRDALVLLVQAGHELRLAVSELHRLHVREGEARQDQERERGSGESR